MAANSSDSLLSVLMKSNNAMSGVTTLVDAMMSIQTQRKIIKSLRDIRTEQRARLSDLKKTTQVLMKATHSALSDQLNEIQDSVDEQLGDDGSDSGDFDNLF